MTTLKLTVNLNSIPETNFPYIPDDTPPNTLEEILNEAAATAEFREIILFFKKGTGNWMERASLRIFNKEPYYDIPLIRLFSDANTIDVAEDLSLGIQVKIGNVLTSADTILVWGSAVEEKKNNGNEELAARIEALELALAGRLTDIPANTLLGRNVGTGVVELLPQAQFAKPSDIDAATTAITNSIATKVGRTDNETITGSKIFTTVVQGNNGFFDIKTNGRAGLDHNNASHLRLMAWGINATTYSGMVFNQYYSDGTGGRNAATLTPTGEWTFGVGGAAFHNFIGTEIRLNGIKILGGRDTGWTAGTGTPNKSAFNSETATLQEVARRALGLEQALRGMGIIN